MEPLVITLGDPAGIGTEVVLGALKQSSRESILCGSWDETVRQARLLDLPFESWRRCRPTDAPGAGCFVDVGPDSAPPIRFGEVQAGAGAIALESIEAGIRIMQQGLGSALVTAPVSKEAIRLTDESFTGHTELLAERCGRTRYGRDFAMYFDSPTLRVALLTVHESLLSALASIRADRVADLAMLLDRELPRLTGTHPRIGVAAVNPHAGEGGLFGEEERMIRSGVEMARAAGVDVSGPHPADTIFHAAASGRYDVVMAMYHDQGLIAVKTLAFERSVNVTLGLPWLRVSVDHGTAFDIAGRGEADAEPMAWAIEWAASHTEAGRW